MFFSKYPVIFITANVTAETCTLKTETEGKYNVIVLWQPTKLLYWKSWTVSSQHGFILKLYTSQKPKMECAKKRFIKPCPCITVHRVFFINPKWTWNVCAYNSLIPCPRPPTFNHEVPGKCLFMQVSLHNNDLFLC